MSMDIKKILSYLDIIKNDCEAQRDALTARDDVEWNCYDAGNWQNLVELCNDIGNEIKECIE
jgi:hypothetical protein